MDGGVSGAVVSAAAERAKARLVHYLGIVWEFSDVETEEISSIVDDIIAAALVEVEQKIRQLTLQLLPSAAFVQPAAPRQPKPKPKPKAKAGPKFTKKVRR